MAQSPQDIFSRARSVGLPQVVSGGIGGIWLALYLAGIDFIQAAANLIILPVEAVGINASNVVQAFIGGAARIIQQGAITAQQSLLPGQVWAIGPFSFAISVGAIGIALYVMAELLSLEPTSDTIPFTFTDLPFLGVDEEEEGD